MAFTRFSGLTDSLIHLRTDTSTDYNGGGGRSLGPFRSLIRIRSLTVIHLAVCLCLYIFVGLRVRHTISIYYLHCCAAYVRSPHQWYGREGCWSGRARVTIVHAL